MHLKNIYLVYFIDDFLNIKSIIVFVRDVKCNNMYLTAAMKMLLKVLLYVE